MDQKQEKAYIELTKKPNIILVGIGGIGSHLIYPLFRYLKYKNIKFKLTLIDGDEIEPKNLERQEVYATHIGMNKAEHFKHVLSDNRIKAINKYLTKKNIADIINDNSIVIGAVDNHFTRKLVNRHALTLSNILIISGGNELHTGTVRTFLRLNGQTINSDLEYLDPSILKAKEEEFLAEVFVKGAENQTEEGCEDLQKTNQQLIWTNLHVACVMGELLYKFLDLPLNAQNRLLDDFPDFVGFDIRTQKQWAEKRKYDEKLYPIKKHRSDILKNKINGFPKTKITRRKAR